MTNSLKKEFAQIAVITQRQGAKKYANWNQSLFQDIRNKTQPSFLKASKKLVNPSEIWRAYLTCVSEMIGCEYIDETALSGDLTRKGLMAFTFLYSIPNFLSQHPKKKQLEAISTTWNLCESLLNAPLWMQKAVTAKLQWNHHFSEIENFLIDVLSPALQPNQTPNWKKPCKLHIMQTRNVTAVEDFLPGHLHFVTPTVLCVHDNRYPDSHIGLFLQKEGKSQCIGETDCLGATYESLQPPTIRFEENNVYIEEQPVQLDYLGEMTHYALSDAGFLVVTTANSQQLWIVESS